MTLKQSLYQQKRIDDLKHAIGNAIKSKLISDIILHDYPKWSIYYKDGDENHSFNYNIVIAGAIYNYLKPEVVK